MSDEINSKLREAEAQIKRVEDLPTGGSFAPYIGIERTLLEAAKLMDEQITMLKEVAAIQQATIAVLSGRLRQAEELQSEIDCGKAVQDKFTPYENR